MIGNHIELLDCCATVFRAWRLWEGKFTDVGGSKRRDDTGNEIDTVSHLRTVRQARPSEGNWEFIIGGKRRGQRG